MFKSVSELMQGKTVLPMENELPHVGGNRFKFLEKSLYFIFWLPIYKLIHSLHEKAVIHRLRYMAYNDINELVKQIEFTGSQEWWNKKLDEIYKAGNQRFIPSLIPLEQLHKYSVKIDVEEGGK